MPHQIIIDIDYVKALRPDWPDDLCSSVLEVHEGFLITAVEDQLRDSIEWIEICAGDDGMRRIHEQQRQAAQRQEVVTQNPYGYMDVAI